MILNGFNFVEDKIILSFQNERRREVCLLRVYDYDYQVALKTNAMGTARKRFTAIKAI